MLEAIETGQPVLKDKVMRDVVAKRYFQPGESSWSDMCRRIAHHVASAEWEWGDSVQHVREIEEQFYDALNSQHIVPSSPIIFNAGTECKMLSACTGVVFADDSIPAILKAVTECATLTADGAGVGYNITPLRYRDAPLSRKGVASGSCSWLNLMDAVGQTVRQGGRNRRAAMIALLHIDHPDAVEFCFIKDQLDRLTHMNISLQVTDAFMDRVKRDDWHHFEFPVGSGNQIALPVTSFDMDAKPDLRFDTFLEGWEDGQVDATPAYDDDDRIVELEVYAVRARWLFDLICEHAHRTGEPGLFFIDRHEAYNPLTTAPVGTVNPCGEVMLNTLTGAQLGLPDVDVDGVTVKSHDSCNLAHLVLPRFVKRATPACKCAIGGECGCDGGWRFVVDWDKIRQYVVLTTRFLDNVIELSEYRPEKIGRANRAIRKNGLGIIGFADLLIMLGFKYGSEPSKQFAHELASWIEFWALAASSDLAKVRGSFALFGESRYQTRGLEFRAFPTELAHPYLARNMWEGLDLRVRGGLRNSMVTMLAPTGSTALIVGNLSNSIEPIFFKEQRRRTVDAVEIVERHWLYDEFLQGNLPSYVTEDLFVEAFNVTPTQHVEMQNVWQQWISNSISKTINLPHTATVDDVRTAYLAAWDGCAKGVTVYRDGSRGFQPVSNAAVAMDAAGKLALGAPALVEQPPGFFKYVPPDADALPPPLAAFEFPTPAVHKLLGIGLPVTRPEIVHGRTYKIEFNGDKIYVTINRDPVSDRVLEVFLNHGKAGSDEMSRMEAIGRLISVGLKYGTPIDAIVKQLRGIGGETQTFYNGRRFASLPDAVGTLIAEDLGWSKPKTTADADQFERNAEALKKQLADAGVVVYPTPPLPPTTTITTYPPWSGTTTWVNPGDVRGASQCPNCKSNAYINQSGCWVCSHCGYSKC